MTASLPSSTTTGLQSSSCDPLILHEDLFTAYMSYVDLKHSEAPATFHRWTLAGCIGALLGRNVWLPFGHGRIYPNQYIMLMGPPGARKGTAMKIGKNLLRESGYKRFAKDRTSKERFLIDMASGEDVTTWELEDLMELSMDPVAAETFIAAEEFADFIGPNNVEFLMMLTNLWDNPLTYEHPKIQSKSVAIEKPTVSLLGAATATTFGMAIPPESLGTGFLSRMILVHSEASGVKTAWPVPPPQQLHATLVARMKDIRRLSGEMKVSKEAKEVGTLLYHTNVPVEDGRFEHYQQRRQTHMLKLALVLAAGELTYTLTAEHIIRANTMLAMAERRMPEALGDFGAGKYSSVIGNVISFMERQSKPVTTNQIYKEIHRDIGNIMDLSHIINNLKLAGRIQLSEGRTPGYVLKKETKANWKEELLDKSWLTPSEIEGVF